MKTFIIGKTLLRTIIQVSMLLTELVMPTHLPGTKVSINIVRNLLASRIN